MIKFLELSRVSFENGVDHSWIGMMSKSGLTTPSDSFFECAKVVEKCFIEFHGPHKLRTEPWIVIKVSSLVLEQVGNLDV
ncbi:hypothetical protein, partial [Klebsiella pneumoniae]|uniref:hypothetical protein n=1 Tax=Klebsiella pneumoniae TaxID=573 RepID=UPI004055860B